MMMETQALPADLKAALLVGRVWRRGDIHGPCVVVVRDGVVWDITAQAPTVADLLDRDDAAQWARTAPGVSLGPVAALLAPTDADTPLLLAPCDLQAIKACGVTFAVSLLERVIEEQAGGDASRAATLRAELLASIGADLSAVRPGAAVGIHRASQWNNPEPEIVLAVNSRSQIVGATLGNDVNLRDFEGRSALLLGKAKDNNGSCAIGPFIRLFDEHFTLDTVRNSEVSLSIEGADDDFKLSGVSRMREISRDPLELVEHASGPHHEYPDGYMLFLGTMFSPIQDRDAPGAGFTHHRGDRVTIASPA